MCDDVLLILSFIKICSKSTYTLVTFSASFPGSGISLTTTGIPGHFILSHLLYDDLTTSVSGRRCIKFDLRTGGYGFVLRDKIGRASCREGAQMSEVHVCVVKKARA